MSAPGTRLVLCTFAVILLTHLGCQDSLTITADNESAPGDAIVEPAPVSADPATPEESSTTELAPVETVDEATPEEPMPEESTELARVTPVTPTVPATPEPETPEEPETTEPEALGIGDPAPPLAIAEWVTGAPIDQLATGQVYVVEFWATWCPPCRTSMPHISELQDHYAEEVQFVGVTREDVDTVRGFLGQEQSEGKTWSEVVTYRLALDADNEMTQTYMRAAGQSGIPTAFIVGADGAVEWIGHPMSMDEPLAKIVAGDWDRAAAIAEFEQKKKSSELRTGLNKHVRAREWDEALALIEEFEASEGPSVTVTGFKVSILGMAGRNEEAGVLQGELVDQAWDDSQMLNQIAWNIAIGRAAGDLELAQRAAERASELKEHGDASILDTVARVHYELGDLEKAIEWQKKAVELDSSNPQITSALERYETELAEDADPATPEDGESEATPEDSESEPEEAPGESGDSAPEE